MKRRHSMWVLAGAMVVLAAFARPVAAQESSRVEVSGGYQSLTLMSDIDETLATGWYADLTGYLTSTFGVVFQVSGNYKTVEESATVEGITARFTADLSVHEFMAGARVVARPNDRIAPFAQFLIGGVRANADVEGSVVGDGITFLAESGEESSTNLAMQAGGGINLMFTRHVGARGAVDFIRIFDEDEPINAFRFAIGAVVAF